MAFRDMIVELRGVVPKLSISYAKTLINRAYSDLRRQNLWSFQVYEANWISPGQITGTTTSIVQGSNQITVDAGSAALINASIQAYNPINQRQFRLGVSTVVNITGWDGTNTFTIDRGWPDPVISPTNSYILYQVYYPAPYQDHLSFVSVRDMVNFTDLILDMNRSWLDEQDPQRTFYYFPTHVIPYLMGADPNNTSTYQFPMFELWGAPLSNRAYQLYGIRRMPDLVNPSDTLPGLVVTEEAVTAMAKYYAFEWAEATKGNMPRNVGTDWKFLMGETRARYGELYKKLRMQDREYMDNWFRVRRATLYGKYFAQYNSISGTAFPGAYMG